jgi:sulfur-oxidizing protein SoxA
VEEKRGPNNVSLERCDLGLGPGVVKGAYTVLPKYFADSGKVEDLESRLVTCMVTLQGFKPEDAKKDPFGGPGKKVPMDALVAYVTSESRGMKMNVADQPSEGAGSLRDRQEDLLLPRRAPRLRLRHLPRRRQPAHPPAGSAQPHQDRRRAEGLHHVARVSRLAGGAALLPVAPQRLLPPAALPELEFVSPASVALTLYLAKNANGGVFDAPSIKR